MFEETKPLVVSGHGMLTSTGTVQFIDISIYIYMLLEKKTTKKIQVYPDKPVS